MDIVVSSTEYLKIGCSFKSIHSVCFIKAILLLLSEICLCANRGAYTKRYRFHAYDSSVKVHWLFIGITAFHRDTYIVPSR